MQNLTRTIGKKVWCSAQDLRVAFAKSRVGDTEPKVYYGGARAGRAGGPQVKVGLLQQSFPEHTTGFNLVYLLSGALYLSKFSLNRLNKLDIPIILNQNGVFFPAWYPDGWEKQNERFARVMERSDHVFYQSEFCKRAADKFVGVQPASWEILYNGVDTKLFSPTPERSLDGRPLKLLLTGKISKSVKSRLLTTIEGVGAARKAGLNVVLDIFGIIDSDVMTEALILIDHFGLEDDVTFCGSYSRAEAPDIYRSADVYVLNTQNDACPNTVLEAMASGLPVLYSSSGGVPELVGSEAGAGLAVAESFEYESSPTARQFAEGLAKIVQNYEAMALCARKRACEKFDISFWYDRHRAVFSEKLGQGK